MTDRITERAFPEPEGYQHFGCPDCGACHLLPAEPDEPAPWCAHRNGTYRWTHFGDFDPEKWRAAGYVPMVRVKVVPA